MTKADLVEEVAKVTELTRKDSEVIVDTLFESVIKALRVGDKLEVRGFGSFRVRQRNARVGRNPKTGEKVEVPAKRVPYFKPSKELKDLINEDGTARLDACIDPQLGWNSSGARGAMTTWRRRERRLLLASSALERIDPGCRPAGRLSWNSQFLDSEPVSVHIRALHGGPICPHRAL